MAELRITVCYARPERQFVEELRLPEGAVLRDALERSSLRQNFPYLDLAQARAGIFGKVKDAGSPLRDGDRVEVYRPLIADPKDSRRRRALKKEGGR